nr:hypothetical protein [Streptomyces mirabilis]
MQPEDLSPSPRIRTTATPYLVRPAPLDESDADPVQFPGDPNATSLAAWAVPAALALCRLDDPALRRTIHLALPPPRCRRH